jgi:hypothetical protein
MSSVAEERVLIARGNLAGTDGAQAAPGSGATITLLDTPLNSTWKVGVPFNRIQLNVYSSHDSGASGVVFNSTFDRGANYRAQSATTYTQATDGARSWDYLMKGGGVQVKWTNSANVLTAWEMEIWGYFDRNPGA